MADESEFVPLSTLVEPGRGISYGIVQPGPPVEDGVPIVRVTDVRAGRISTETPLRVSPDVEASYARTRLRGGELLLTLVGTVGESAVVPQELAGWNTARAVAVIPVRSDIGATWVRIALQTPVVRSRIDSRLNTTVQATLNLRDVAELPIWVPKPEQRTCIGHILGTLDDKIELNRRMSETLEAMARALFKSWFMDFDPVRAKAEGRDTGLPKEIAELFPDRFVDSELGEIPEGWAIGELGDVLQQIIDRCTPSNETQSRPYVPIECIAARSLLLADTKPGEEARSSLTSFRSGDLLFGAMRPYFHKVAIAPFDGTTRTTVFVLRPRISQYFSFATLLLHDKNTVEYATNHSTGSTIPYAVWQGSLEAMPIVLPPPQIRVGFDSLVRPFLNAIPPILERNRTLV